MQCRTLYVGVSDGARIDVFRRYNEGAVNNEQIVAMIEISALKQAKLKEKLQERLDAIKSTAPATFEWVCLIDDFTASGTTSIRDEGEGKWGGKVERFIQEVDTTRNEAPLITDDAHIQVHHYMASKAASISVSDLLERFQATLMGLRFIPSFSYVLPEDVVIASAAHPDLAALLEKRYDPGVCHSCSTTTHPTIQWRRSGREAIPRQRDTTKTTTCRRSSPAVNAIRTSDHESLAQASKRVHPRCQRAPTTDQPPAHQALLPARVDATF